MNISKELIDHLRNGGILQSSEFIVSGSQPNNLGIWICAAEYMLDKLVHEISDGAQQMIEVTEGQGIFSFELSKDNFTDISFDYDSSLSDLSMRLRAPIWICPTSNKDASQNNIDTNKIVPLPPEFDSSCSALFNKKMPKMVFYADGTFKLIKT